MLMIKRMHFITCWRVRPSQLVREELRGNKKSLCQLELEASAQVLQPPVCHHYTLVFQHQFVPVPKWRLSRFCGLSSNVFCAIFTSCFEMSCVSCPLAKQKLADLMCKTKKIRQCFRYTKQVEVQRINLAAWCQVIKSFSIKHFLISLFSWGFS